MDLLVGVPFSGKTVSACTWPKPLLLIDFDDGFESVKHAKNKLGQLIVPDWKEVTIIILNKYSWGMPSEVRAKLIKKTA